MSNQVYITGVFNLKVRAFACFICIMLGCRISKNRYAPKLEYARFPGGDSALVSYIEKVRMPDIYLPDSTNFYNDSFFEEEMTLRIDTLGNINDTGYAIFAGFNIIYPDLINIINKMPKWQPATINDPKTIRNSKISDIVTLTIRYYYESKKPKQVFK